MAVAAPGSAIAAHPVASSSTAASGLVAIHAPAGVSAIALSVPAATTYTEADFNVATDGAFGMFLVRRPRDLVGADVVPGFDECDFCYSAYGVASRSGGYLWARTYEYFSPQEPMPPGIHEFYFATLAPLTLVVRFDEAGGESEFHAGGVADGEVADLPSSCPALSSCPVEFGGATRRAGVSRPGLVLLETYTEPTQAAPNPTLASAVGCIYSDSEGRSTNPADHPLGCDYLPSADDPAGEGTSEARTRAVAFAQHLSHQYIARSRGDTYLGFTARSLSTTAAPAGAWGVWLTAGIDCDSEQPVGCESR